LTPKANLSILPSGKIGVLLPNYLFFKKYLNVSE
jgi:hypothetical protein